MQAALRQVAGRVAEGLSTGLVVWAGRPTCPACECSPVLQCPPLTCSIGDVAHASLLTPIHAGLHVCLRGRLGLLRWSPDGREG